MKKKTVIDVSNLYARIRMEYKNKFNLTPKIYISKKDPVKSRYFKYFLSLHCLFKKIPDIDQEKYIRAQFEMSRRETYPPELTSQFAIKRYFMYLKKIKKQGNKQPLDIDNIINLDEEYIQMYAKVNNIKNIWDHKMTINNKKYSLPVYFYLNKRISIYRFLFETKFTDELKLALNEKHYKKILLLRETLRNNE